MYILERVLGLWKGEEIGFSVVFVLICFDFMLFYFMLF